MEPMTDLTTMVTTLAKTFALAREGVDNTRLARDLVYNAGRLAWRIREGGLTTTTKTNTSDVVTQADTAAELFITHALALLRPDDGVLGEEGTHTPSTSGYTWVIDPVDGTYNFSRGSDYWCSALALVSGDPTNPEKVILGAVHRPAMGYTWIGGEDHPTTLDDQPLTPLADTTPESVCLATYLHPTNFATPHLVDTWTAITQRFASVRMLGAGSVDLASVAAGEHGCWVQHDVKPWDWLPGKALVEAAGGAARTVVDPEGTPWCVAGPRSVVEEVAAIICGDRPWAATGSEWSGDLEVAQRLADAADALTMDRFTAADLTVDSKPDLTPVSDADINAERLLREMLGSLRPDDDVLGEEFGGDPVTRGRQWVVDPIDGTKNYVRGVPVWATLIALLVDGKPVVGVVSAPALGRRWVGISGVGAWSRFERGPWRELGVSKVSRVEDCSVSLSSLTGWRDRGLRENVLELTDSAWRLRGFGDFFSYCLVAEGAVDVAAEPEVSLWDLAALVPVVEGAGGVFTSLDGVEGPAGGDALATNGLLHDDVLNILRTGYSN